MNAFSMLSEKALETLAAALEAGRITGSSLLQLRAVLGDAASESLSHQMDEMLRGGFSATQIATVLRLVASDRRRGASNVQVELVWSGPEATTSTSRDTGVVVRELFSSAQRSVLVAGFAVHRGKEIFRELARRMIELPSLDVVMLLNIPRGPGDTTVTNQLVARFALAFRRDHWPGNPVPAVYYDPRSLAVGANARSSLHAKCVIVDEEIALVTSANFTEAAQVRNIEAGALIRDASFSQSLCRHFRALIETNAVSRVPLG